MGVIEKSSYIFYFSITLETIHGIMIRGDIMFPYKTDLLGLLMIAHAQVHLVVVF